MRIQPPTYLSWSRLSLLVEDYPGACPRRYAYRYVAGIPAPTSPALAAGTAFDRGLQALFSARQEGNFGSALEAARQAAREALEAAWAQTQEPPERLLEQGLLVEQALAHFARERPALVPAALQSRHRFSVRTPDGGALTVLGFSDRIDPDGTVVEHKWSGSARWRNGADGNQEWEQEWAASTRDQLALYWLARRAEEARGVPQPAPVVPRGRAEVLYQRRGLSEPQLRCLEFEFTLEDETRILRALAQAWEVLRAARFPAQPGPACRWCPYQERCRADEASRGLSFAELAGVPPPSDSREVGEGV